MGSGGPQGALQSGSALIKRIIYNYTSVNLIRHSISSHTDRFLTSYFLIETGFNLSWIITQFLSLFQGEKNVGAEVSDNR